MPVSSSTLQPVRTPFLSIILLLIVIFFAQPKLVAAQESASSSATPSATPAITPPSAAINLTLTPITLQFEVEPGGTETGEIRIRNNGTQDEPLKVSFGTFSFNERTQQIDLNKEVDPQTLSWITVDKPTIIVRPSEWETVNVTFSPPAEASLTYYYAVIFSRIDQVTPDEPTSTKVTGAPAVLVLTNVDSALSKRELQLESFSVPKVWIEYLPQTFLMRIKNTGNVHLAPIGNIFIDSSNEKDIAVLPANPKGSMILPSSVRELETQWNDGFPRFIPKMQDGQPVTSDDGTAETELEWDFSQADRFRIGKYTGHLLLVYDNGERDIPIESYVSFWVIPWRISLIALTVVALVLFGIWSLVRSLYRSVKRPKSAS